MNIKLLITSTFSAFALAANADISVVIDANEDNRPISPYIYGKNGATSFNNDPTNETDIKRISESGIRFVRLNNGNNATKYNWRRKLTCHPDWYKNVYYCDWDKCAEELQERLPQVQGMFAFQLLGKVAKTGEYNFNDYAYTSQYGWIGCSSPVCGGGDLDSKGNVIKKGNPDLYLEDWPADSTVGIYPYWRDQLGLDMSQFQYWSMDNEFEMWGWTHNDLVSTEDKTIFEPMMQNYFATAKAIRAIDPDVKLCGPVAGSEWTWFYTANGQPTYDGKTYCWLEYFIMRCAEEEKKTGIKMLDVLDIHFYPEDKKVNEVLQSHRVLYDREYEYPYANGLFFLNGNWNDKLKKEYIFGRCQEWIDKYFGPNRGITFGVSEYNNKSEDFSPTITALSYASFLGEGSRNGMDFFTPWTWRTGMWETVHLFGRYAKDLNVSAISSNEEMLSAYTSISTDRDSMTVILINRSETEKQNISMTIGNFDAKDGDVEAWQLSNLPAYETFNSHTDNALTSASATVSSGTVSVSVPPLSMTAIVLESKTTGVDEFGAQPVAVYPNPATEVIYVSNNGKVGSVDILTTSGVVVKSVNATSADDVAINVTDLDKSVYVVRINSADGVKYSTVVVK